MLTTGDRVLFQGDSITDCGRDKAFDPPHTDPAQRGTSLGNGYPLLIAAHLAADRPDLNLTVRNLGISGNRIVDLAARIKEHGWNLQPTVLSILIGINDTWHTFSRDSGVDHVRFERTYRQLLADTRERLPEVRLVLCEPFLLPCGVAGQGWFEDLAPRQAVVRQLAKEFSAVFVPFQAAFDEASRRAPPAHWAGDGVHPSPAGHQIMARAWLAAVG